MALVVVLTASVWTASAALAQTSGRDPIGTVPGANQVLSGAPARLAVVPPAAATAGTAKVLNSTGKRVAAGVLAPVGGDALGMDLPPLGRGTYLVGWSAGSDRGSFAFTVTGGGRSPALVAAPNPPPALGPLQDNLIEWIPLVAVMIFAGVLGLRFLVSAPAARRSRRTEVLERTDRRLVRVAAVAIAVFVPMTVVELAYGDGVFDFGSIWPSLGADGDGHVVGARLALTALAALLVVPQAFRRRPYPPLLVAGTVCGLGELALREVPTAIQPDMARAVFNAVCYVGHLWAAAAWVGGLVGLLFLALPSVVGGRPARTFWPVAIRRFSAVAMVSIGVLVLSGLWLYWVHISGIDQLFTTLYGQTLLVKLIVVLVLVLIGGFNQFWLLPRIDGQRATGDDRGLEHTLVRHFRATIAVEVALALGVLFIAPLLAGSARNQAFQAGPDVLGQTTTVAGTSIELAPSGLQPGLTDYTVKVHGPGIAPRLVTLRFADPKLGFPAQRATAVAVGNGTYRVAGYYTPVVGNWQVRVTLDGGSPATFTLPITTVPADLPKAPAPPVLWTTWLAGSLEILLVAGVLYSSFRISRRLTALRSRPPGPPPATPVEHELVDA